MFMIKHFFYIKMCVKEPLRAQESSWYYIKKLYFVILIIRTMDTYQSIH